ncbi:MAG TPA: hypothetical protein VF628_09060 [Allosphingosinicella sp.]|jgi:hypothetical protein
MAKAKSAKLPKKIGGVKLPKELRKGGGSLVALLNQPLAREIAIAAALAALGARKDVRRAAKRARDEAGVAGVRAAGKVDWVGPAVAAAAAEIGRRLLVAHQSNGGPSSGPSKTAQVIRIVEKLAATRR